MEIAHFQKQIDHSQDFPQHQKQENMMRVIEPVKKCMDSWNENSPSDEMYNRRFRNPDLSTCWLNSLLQLLLNGLDYLQHPPQLTSQLGKELFRLKECQDELDPSTIKQIIVNEEDQKIKQNPSANLLGLRSGQQCVRDCLIVLTENQLAWPEVFSIFSFQIEEQTLCSNHNCGNISRGDPHNPQLYVELDVPPSGSDLGDFVERELNQGYPVDNYHCQEGCGQRLTAEHKTTVHTIVDKHFLMIILRRVVDGVNGIEINQNRVKATGDVEIKDSQGNTGLFQPIAVIGHSGSIGVGGETSGHYVCDVRTKQGSWFKTNDNQEPSQIAPNQVSEQGTVILYFRRQMKAATK